MKLVYILWSKNIFKINVEQEKKKERQRERESGRKDSKMNAKWMQKMENNWQLGKRGVKANQWWQQKQQETKKWKKRSGNKDGICLTIGFILEWTNG